MNFSSTLMNGMGISLGSLELATDYLFANTELYEPELNDIKSSQDLVVKKPKINKPKISKESIINKFDITYCKPTVIIDEVIHNDNCLVDDEDFDFSFDEIDGKSNEQLLESVNDTGENTEDIDSMLEANSLMQRLQGMNTSELNDDFETEEDELDFEEDELDFEDEEQELADIELEFEDNDNEDVDDQINIEDDIDLDDIDIEEDIENIDDDIEDIDLDIDEELEDEEQVVVKPSVEVKVPVVETVKTPVKKETTNTENSTKNKPISNPKVNNGITYDNSEIDSLKKDIASLNKEIQRLTKEKTLKSTSGVVKDKNKNVGKDSLEELLSRQDNKPKQKTVDKHVRYSEMTTEQLYKYVRQFMIKLGVDKRPVDLSALNTEFGEKNIKKLIIKSYLIKIGKGVTIGR